MDPLVGCLLPPLVAVVSAPEVHAVEALALILHALPEEEAASEAEDDPPPVLLLLVACRLCE